MNWTGQELFLSLSKGNSGRACTDLVPASILSLDKGQKPDPELHLFQDQEKNVTL
jgi:hypothetical protein